MAHSFAERVYASLPIFLQNSACTLAGLKIRRYRYGKRFWEMSRFLNESQWWSYDELVEYQNEQLRRLIRHAYDSVPYYREIFGDRKLVPDDIRTTSDLEKLPVLTKQIVRTRHSDLISKSLPERRRVVVHTGGTTGKALAFILEDSTEPRHWAFYWRCRNRFDVDVDEPFIVFAGRGVVPLNRMSPPIWRRNLAMKQTYVSVHHLMEQNMAPLVEYLQKRRVAYYSGYPSALHLLARYLLDNNIQLPHPPRMIFTGAETVTPSQRQSLKDALGADVADHYSATEMCVFISECEKHSYHVDMEHSFVEFLPIEGADPNVRRIVGTGLMNYAMPLIRYDMGDVATIGPEESCSCGRSSPRVECIDGRIESYIVTPDGRRLGRLDFLFKKTEAIEEGQLIQDDLDHILIKIVRADHFKSDDEQEFMKEVRHYLGEEIKIDLDYVDHIPREANGKFRQIVSKLPAPI
jgi:phenylacetate-CoA ligase